jgi:hypothetical protein
MSLIIILIVVLALVLGLLSINYKKIYHNPANNAICGIPDNIFTRMLVFFGFDFFTDDPNAAEHIRNEWEGERLCKKIRKEKEQNEKQKEKEQNEKQKEKPTKIYYTEDQLRDIHHRVYGGCGKIEN